MVTGVVKGILASAKIALKHNSMVLLLEAPAQHFVYNINAKGVKNSSTEFSGVYDPLHRRRFHRTYIPGPCCQPTNNTESGNFRNIVLLKELHAQDPNWKDYIGWLPFYDFSQMSYNNHVDTNGDCTHFQYQPYFYDPLYLAIEMEVSRLDHLRQILEQKQ